MRWTSVRRIRTVSRPGGDRLGSLVLALRSSSSAIQMGAWPRVITELRQRSGWQAPIRGARPRCSQLVLALGLRGVEDAVVDRSQVQVGELVGEQGGFGLFIGDLGPQDGVAVHRQDDLVQAHVEAFGARARLRPSRRLVGP